MTADDLLARTRWLNTMAACGKLPELYGPWRRRFSPERMFVPMTFPAPIPDYTPDELERIEAAEAKRARRNEKARLSS